MAKKMKAAAATATETVGTETVDVTVEDGTVGIETVGHEAETDAPAAAPKVKVKTVKVRVPRMLEFEIGDTVAFTVTNNGAKMHYGTVDGIEENGNITVRTNSGRLIERQPVPALLVKVAGHPEDYLDEIRKVEVDLGTGRE